MGVIKGLSRIFSKSPSTRNGAAVLTPELSSPTPPVSSIGLTDPSRRDAVLPDQPVEVTLPDTDDVATRPVGDALHVEAMANAAVELAEEDDAISDDEVYEPDVLDGDLDTGGGPSEIESAIVDRAGGALGVRRPRNKRELIDELRRNYDEVLGLVRKMDGHLDAERVRGERMMEIAERIPPALAVLPELRQQNARLTDAMERLAEATERASTRTEAQRAEVAREQREAIDSVREAVYRSQEAGERVAGSLGDFSRAVETVATGNERLSQAVIDAQTASDQREREMAETIAGAQRWMVTAVSICGAVVALATITALIVVLG